MASIEGATLALELRLPEYSGSGLLSLPIVRHVFGSGGPSGSLPGRMFMTGSCPRCSPGTTWREVPFFVTGGDCDVVGARAHGEARPGKAGRRGVNGRNPPTSDAV